MIDGPRRTYINFKKADWARYAEACDKYLAEAGETRTAEQAEKTFRKAVNKARHAEACDKYLAEAGETRTAEQAEKTFRKAVNKASGLFISAGHIHHFQPTLPPSAKSITDERDRISGLNPADETLNDLNIQIKKLVEEGKRAKWQSAVDKCDHQAVIIHLWRLVKCLSGKYPPNSPNTAVRFADKIYLDLKKIANKFSHQFTPPPTRLAGDKSKGQLKRQFHPLPLTGTLSFTPANTKEAILLAKLSTAIGPDGMSTLHQRSSLMVPSTISLTSILFHPAQHGFRPKHLTCTALSTITADIAADFSRKKAGSPNSIGRARSDNCI